ncbi:hypothetical protein KFL_006960090 [Klebsormidium nitens]|uniref:Secreted protein n=1 Tax=Klebsormidium nitens TaxID=105231 RepID=A0A1Y1IL71_KLENI|nr:hypothetical protein KFL_006960090 [Klebsormidium nitens]|eukprot:GAQ90882.1 hypothetical protein KFL_006960090 [Klebsormidium nitens]
MLACPPMLVFMLLKLILAGWSSWAWRRLSLDPSSPRSSSLCRPDALPLAARPAQLRLMEMCRLGCQPAGPTAACFHWKEFRSTRCYLAW